VPDKPLSPNIPLSNVAIIIPIAPNETAHKALLKDLENTNVEIILSSEGSRAESLNIGAQKATREILCFLHADTRIDKIAINALENANNPDVINYFNLSYDGGLAQLNAIGANLRSSIFGLPYGDQGFTLTKALFNKIGGFPENYTFGEDLLFIRKAKQKDVHLNRLPAKLITSPRQYEKTGWLKLTLIRQYQLFKLIRIKL